MLAVVVFVFVCLSFVPTPSFSSSRTHEPSAELIPAQSLRLLLSTHNRLFWYHPASGEEHTLHDGQGVYYGVFPAQDTDDGSERLRSLWVVSRPHNWHPQTTREWLLHLDAETGAELARVRIPSRFTHDAVRAGSSVWICNTGGGELLRYSFPEMALESTMRLFTAREHVNTVAVLDDESVWVVLHNLGDSMAARVDRETGHVGRRIRKIGKMVHGLVAWRGVLVLLDSERASLVTLDPDSEARNIIWQGEAGTFLKGLAVVDDVAYFGIAPAVDRHTRVAASYSCDLAAVSLLERRLLSRRTLNTSGLLNVVSAPQLAVGSTYVALSTAPHGAASPADGAVGVARAGLHASGSLSAQLAGRLGGGVASARALGSLALLTGSRGDGDSSSRDGAAAGGAQQLGGAGLDRSRWGPLLSRGGVGAASGRWPSGAPYLPLPQIERGVRVNRPKAVGQVQLLLGAAPPPLLRGLQDALARLPESYWDPDVQAKVSAVISDREANIATFKPGVDTIYLLFSTQSMTRIWQLPLYERLRAAVEPLLRHVIGDAALGNLVRLQLARMRPGARIMVHADQGKWALRAHRIHVVLATNPGVSFRVCVRCRFGPHSPERRVSRDCRPDVADTTCVQLEVGEGQVFEVDNAVLHGLENKGSQARIHLVADVAETAMPARVVLKPGQHCHYNQANRGVFESGC